MAIRLRRIVGPGIHLASKLLEGERHPVWIQAATEGVYKGHPVHPKIELTPAVFAEVIANFRAHPSFALGEDGFGCNHVVRLDYEHTSEMFPVDGVAQRGLPAPGWVMDLEIRDGDEGKAELWALVDMGVQLWGQVQRGEYHWTSVAIDPNAKDRVTGKKIGHALTSLAITNNPFILGMEEMSLDSTESKPSQKIAASGQHGFLVLEETKRGLENPSLIACAMGQWGEAETPDEAIVGLRELFGLDQSAEAADVLLELQTFEQMMNEGTWPEGVNVDWVTDRLRSMLGMKTLAGRAEVIERAKSVVAAVVEKEVTDGGTPAPADQGPPVEGPSASTETVPETQPMSAKTLTARLAPTFRLSADADDDTVVDAVKSTASSRKKMLTGLCRVLKLADTEDEDEILKAAEDAAADSEKVEEAKELKDVFDQLKELFEADNMTETLSKATKMLEQAKKHEGMIEELNALKQKLADGEVEKAEEEVEAIAACHKVDDRTKRLLMSQVIREEKDGDKAVRVVRPEALEQIRKDWPITDEQRVKQLLTSGVFAGSDGKQLGGPITNAPDAPETAPVHDKPAGATPHDEVKKKIALCAGRNEIEKAISYLEDTEAAFAGLPDHKKPQAANQFLKTGQLGA